MKTGIGFAHGNIMMNLVHLHTLKHIELQMKIIQWEAQD